MSENSFGSNFNQALAQKLTRDLTIITAVSVIRLCGWLTNNSGYSSMEYTISSTRLQSWNSLCQH